MSSGTRVRSDAGITGPAPVRRVPVASWPGLRRAEASTTRLQGIFESESGGAGRPGLGEDGGHRTSRPTAEPKRDPSTCASGRFYEGLDSFASFAGITDPVHYRPLPDDWELGLADVVDSSAAIAKGRYRAVNLVGAAAITAATNAALDLRLPFAFSGDGACVAAPRTHMEGVRDALARTADWARDALDLTLRVGSVPVSVLRAAGHDVRVARFAVTGQVSYAMFSGGGLAWAEARVKEGRFALGSAAPGTRPDLSGLRFDFASVEARRGLILSVIAVPEGTGTGFEALVSDVVMLLETMGDAGRPRLAAGRQAVRNRVTSDAAADRSARRRASPGAGPCHAEAPSPAEDGSGPACGTDFRKFDDALRLTVDCSPRVADAVAARLERGRRDGVCRFGLHRQSAANRTCATPTRAGTDHVHFIDGAGGGYAIAAAALKRDRPAPVLAAGRA